MCVCRQQANIKKKDTLNERNNHVKIPIQRKILSHSGHAKMHPPKSKKSVFVEKERERTDW